MADLEPVWRRVLFRLRGGNRLNGWDDEFTARGFHLLLATMLVWVGLMESVVVPLFAGRKLAGEVLFLILGAATLAALILLRRGRRRAAAALFLSVFWCVTGGVSLFGSGIRNWGNYGALVLILGAGWLLGRAPALGFAAASLVLTLIEACLAHFGHPLPNYFPGAPLALWTGYIGIIVLVVVPTLSILDAGRRHISALHESEERFRGLSDAALEGIMIHEGGVIRDANLAFARLFGYARPEELIGKYGPEDLLTPESRVRIRQCKERREMGVTEVTGVRKDGTTFAAETESRPVKYLGHDASLVACRDITERRRSLDALRESETRFRTLTEDAPVAISMSRLGRVTYANPTYLRMFGFESFQELDGVPTMERFAPQCRDEVTERANRRAQGQPVPREYESIGRRADGSEFPMLVAVITMQFAEGPALVAFVTDLTGPKRLEEDRLRLEHQFQQAQKIESIGRLAGGIAHDFNNLLTVINGYSRLLLGKMKEGDLLRGGLEEICKAGKRAAGLTQQLLAFSRKQVLEPRVLDVNQVVGEMQPMLARLLGEDVELRVELHPEAAMARVDPHQLEQVIMNLAVNAKDAMARGGTLSIRTAVVDWDEGRAQSCPGAHAGSYVMLAVSDSGVGMDEETRRRAFEPFFTTKGAGKGTGLGLSTVHGIVEQSGGSIEVDSELGHGTTFKIYLPSTFEEATDEQTPEAALGVGGNETVLVVEDQAEVLGYVATVLREYGYRVLQAGDAGEALQICEDEGEHIELLLTDVVMPNLSGRELAELLVQRRRGMKVLFMSGYADDASVRHGVVEGATQLIQKPFTPGQLAIKVREMLAAPAGSTRILIADDEPSVRSYLRTVLEDGGYEVVEAANGSQALKEVRAGRVDVVITDLVMPEREGLETIRILRKEQKGIGIIAMSGEFGGQYLTTARLLGAEAVLSKPLSREVLLATVAEVLRSRR